MPPQQRQESFSDQTLERCLACEADAVGTVERRLPAAAGRGQL